MKKKFILSPSFLDEAMPGLESLIKPGWIINKPSLPETDKQDRMAAIHKPLADFVTKTIAAKELPVSIAGDCCTAIAVLAGLQHAGINPTLIWFDAHGDFNTPETSPGGFLGGMPLAMIAGKGSQAMPNAVRLTTLPENKIILTDGRDLDPGERILVQKSQLTHLSSVEELLKFPIPEGPIYIHFDTDIVSDNESPAQNYPAKGGSSSSIIKNVFEHLTKSGQITAVSLSSWNPELDINRKSEKISMSLLYALLDNV
ncbi:MAG: arginase family protein [Calditrichia bacterium]|nr:arginase family protein [Calditrichia bacterium]